MTRLDLSIVFIEDPKQGGYTSYFLQFPNIIAEGNTKREALQNLFNATSDVLEVENLLNL